MKSAKELTLTRPDIEAQRLVVLAEQTAGEVAEIFRPLFDALSIKGYPNRQNLQPLLDLLQDRVVWEKHEIKGIIVLGERNRRCIAIPAKQLDGWKQTVREIWQNRIPEDELPTHYFGRDQFTQVLPKHTGGSRVRGIFG
jgi:hypothetical protein